MNNKAIEGDEWLHTNAPCASGSQARDHESTRHPNQREIGAMHTHGGFANVGVHYSCLESHSSCKGKLPRTPKRVTIPQVRNRKLRFVEAPWRKSIHTNMHSKGKHPRENDCLKCIVRSCKVLGATPAFEALGRVCA